MRTINGIVLILSGIFQVIISVAGFFYSMSLGWTMSNVEASTYLCYMTVPLIIPGILILVIQIFAKGQKVYIVGIIATFFPCIYWLVILFMWGGINVLDDIHYIFIVFFIFLALGIIQIRLLQLLKKQTIKN